MENVGFFVCAALGFLALEMNGIVVENHSKVEADHSLDMEIWGKTVIVKFYYNPQNKKIKRGTPQYVESKRGVEITLTPGETQEVTFEKEFPNWVEVWRQGGGGDIITGEELFGVGERWNEKAIRLVTHISDGKTSYQFIIPPVDKGAPPAPNPYTSQRSGMAGGSSNATGDKGDSKSAASTTTAGS